MDFKGPSQLELPFTTAPKKAPAPVEVVVTAPVPVRSAYVLSEPKRPALPARTASAPVPVKAPEPARGGFRVIQGGGEKKKPEPLGSRDAVVRVLIETGADLLLRKISSERAEEIQGRVDRVLALFDQVDAAPAKMAVLQKELDELELLMQQTRDVRRVSR